MMEKDIGEKYNTSSKIEDVKREIDNYINSKSKEEIEEEINETESMFEQLNKYLENATQEELDADWEKLKKYNEVGPEIVDLYKSGYDDAMKESEIKVKFMENKKEKLTTGFCQDAEYKCTEANYTAASTTIDAEDGENCCCQNECYEIHQPEGVSVLNEAYEYAKDFIILSEQNDMFKPFMKELREAYLKGFKYMMDGGNYCNIDLSFDNVFYDNLRDVGCGFWAAYKTFIKNAFNAGVNFYCRYSEGKIRIFDIENVDKALAAKGDELSGMELWAKNEIERICKKDNPDFDIFSDEEEFDIIKLPEKKPVIKVVHGNIKRGGEVIKFLENLGGVNKSCCSGKNESFYYHINHEGCIDFHWCDDSFFDDYELEVLELPEKKPTLKVIKGDPIRGAEVIKLLESMGGENIYDYIGNDPKDYYFITDKDYIEYCPIYSNYFNDYELEIIELPIQEKQEYHFRPFDTVLVRDYNDHQWICALFSNIDNNKTCKFVCSGSHWKYCIPYEGNERFLGTTDGPKEYTN